MRLVSDLKGGGYLISTASVLLLGAVAWKSAGDEPWMLACVALGAALSIVGMMLRWRSHRIDQHQQDARDEAVRSRSAAPRSVRPG